MVYRKTERVLSQLAERRVDIIAGAIQMANDVGLDGLNVNHIGRFAGVATGTIYLHFPDRDELLAAVVAQCAQEDVKAMAEASSREHNAMLRLTRALQRFVQLYNSSNLLHPSLMAREGYRKAIARALEGETIYCLPTDQQWMAETLAMAMMGALHAVLLQGRPSKARLDALLEAVLRIADVTPETYRARMLEVA